MSRKKNVVKSLLDSAEAAFFAAIEIHNKPRIPYRYATSTMLIINAWELVLKAFIYKYIQKKDIYEKRTNQIGETKEYTITFSKALTKVTEYINHTEGRNAFKAVNENLFHLVEYRNNSTHYFEEELEPVIFMLLSKSTINFNVFVDKYFKRDIMNSDNLIILPIGFKLPFEPIDYLKKKDDKQHHRFIVDVINSINKLHSEGIEESIVVGFNVFLSSVKKVTNADIIAALDPTELPDATLAKKVRLTDDPNAPTVRMDETEVIKKAYPFTYDDFTTQLRSRIPNIKMNKEFFSYLKLIKSNKEFYMSRLLNPLNPKSSKTGFYSSKAIDKLVEIYENTTRK